MFEWLMADVKDKVTAVLVNARGVKDDFKSTLLHVECLGFGETAGRNVALAQNMSDILWQEVLVSDGTRKIPRLNWTLQLFTPKQIF